MINSFWKGILENLAYKSRAVAFGIWDEDGNIIHLNEVMYDIKSLSGEKEINFAYPDFNTLRNLQKDNSCIYVGYITYGIDTNQNSTLFSKVFYHEKTYLIFSYLDVIETLQDTNTLGKLNQEVNNLQRKLTKENIQLEKTLEEVNTLQAELEERTFELEKNNDELYKANIEKNKHIGIVAHDLRNPIGIISSYVDLMIRDHDELNKEECLRYLKKILDKSNYALNLMESYLDATQIESGTLKLVTAEENIIEIVERALLNHELNAKSKHQKLELIAKENSVLAEVDANKIEQVLDNLISNAQKFSHPDTTIKITVASHDENHIFIEVRDQGVGIPKHEQLQIFKAYKTSSAKPTAGEKSTGLGLTSVKKIINAHSGDIHLESEIGEGSTFRIILPKLHIE
jgi:signal transduction histidine kinase